MNKQKESSNNDLTQLRKVIETQKDQISQLKIIIDDLPGDVYWKRFKGDELIYSGMNRTGTESLHKMGFKWKLKDILGKTDNNLFDKETAETFIRNDWEVIRSGNVNTREETAILPSGKKIIQLSTKRPLLDKKGHTIGVTGVSIDITELKETQSALQIALEKAQAASFAKTEFLENMRHDIRTPLSGIVGCARIIQAKPNDSEKVSEYAADIIRSSEALLNFLNKILEGIKVATGEMPFFKKKFDFKKNIQAILDLNQSLAAKKNLKLTLELDEKIPPYLVGDPVRLQRILLELVTNALRFTQQGSIDIQIKLKKQEAQQVVVEITVSDTGIGIPADKQDEIFTRFTRLTPSHQGIYLGLGLGLSIVKQFVDDLGGEIYVKSQIKQGTTFTCIIPFQEPLVMDDVGVEDKFFAFESEESNSKTISEAISATIQSAHEDLKSDQRKILLVEDDKLSAKIAKSILSELNCVIDIAPDAKTALQRVQVQDYHLILMDIGLPDMDGIALTHRIRLQQWQQTNTTPIVGLTAHIDVENRQRCLDAGMNTVILKPLKKETALELLKAFIPDPYLHQIASDIKPSGAILDLASIKTLLKNEELIKDCIHLMLIGLKKELIELPRLHQSANWQAIREIAHRRQGGASYCGAKRLEQACSQIVDYLREKGPGEQANVLYLQLLQEMEATKAACEAYIKQ